MIGPTDLLHPSPTPHFKTFQMFLIYCPKRPSYRREGERERERKENTKKIPYSKRALFSPKMSQPTSLLYNGHGGSLRGGGLVWPECEVHHSPRLRMSGVISLFSLYTFTAWTGKNLPFVYTNTVITLQAA
jgi:hypothetical protein